MAVTVIEKKSENPIAHLSAEDIEINTRELDIACVTAPLQRSMIVGSCLLGPGFPGTRTLFAIASGAYAAGVDTTARNNTACSRIQTRPDTTSRTCSRTTHMLTHHNITHLIKEG